MRRTSRTSWNIKNPVIALSFLPAQSACRKRWTPFQKPTTKDIAHAAALGLRPGGDIMIHGLGPLGRKLNRPDWTAGCIAVTDEEIEEIFAMINPGVPVFIYP